MKMIKLGRTDLGVSQLCLGSMTWGTQNTEAEGHAQLDRAVEAGINFVDTAEMYPVNPVSKENAGKTEAIIGTWFAGRKKRDDVVLATKVSGAGNMAVRDGAPISSATIDAAIEGSLRRLQTDYIDLYQLHWPNRGSYMFRQNWTYDPSAQVKEDTIGHMEDVLEALDKHRAKGTIRHFGLSNESAWGTMEWLRLAAARGWPRVESIQNEYSLLCRLYDTDLAELSHNEDITLLAFSPLAAGYLSGKYLNGAVPAGSRKSVNDRMGGRETPRVHEAVAAYKAVADKHGLDLVQMSLAWCMTRPFPISPIFGATSLDQLETCLAADAVTLSDEVMADLEAAHRAHPMPY